MNNRSFENRERTLKEIKYFFFKTLYFWTITLVSHLVISYHDFLVLFSSSSVFSCIFLVYLGASYDEDLGNEETRIRAMREWRGIIKVDPFFLLKARICSLCDTLEPRAFQNLFPMYISQCLNIYFVHELLNIKIEKIELIHLIYALL
jgi:hypothetical protein